jgi:cell division protein FtsL
MKRKEKISKALAELVQGSFLVNDSVRSIYPFILFLVGMAVISIYSSHSADSKVYTMSKLRNEMKELNSDYIETRSKLMEVSSETKVLNRAKKLGLVRKENPPIKIVLTDE